MKLRPFIYAFSGQSIPYLDYKSRTNHMMCGSGHIQKQYIVIHIYIYRTEKIRRQLKIKTKTSLTDNIKCFGYFNSTTSLSSTAGSPTERGPRISVITNITVAVRVTVVMKFFIKRLC